MGAYLYVRRETAIALHNVVLMRFAVHPVFADAFAAQRINFVEPSRLGFAQAARRRMSG
jgi:hypothetical protein